MFTIKGIEPADQMSVAQAVAITHQENSSGRYLSDNRPHAVVQRNEDLNAVKRTFNAQQGPVPDKKGLVNLIGRHILSLANPRTRLDMISEIRNEMDVVLSVFTDGLVAGGLAADGEKLLGLKDQITNARLLCESFYRRCLISSDAEQANALREQAYEQLQAAWSPVLKLAEKVHVTLKKTDKTGAREARTWGAEKDDSIDIRATKLAQLVEQRGFIPDIVVGLPTAGAHIAARVAGALNVFPANASQTTELMTFRPRYVKRTKDTTGRSQEQIDKDNEQMLQRELSIKLLPKSASLSMKPLVRVLVVDDFSASGGSLLLAASKIRETLALLNYTPDVRTAVSRYTNAQLRNTIGEDNIENPIDYVVGTHGSGERSEVGERLTDGFAPREEFMDDAENWERGWTESGQEALQVLGLDAPPPASSGFGCYITTACVQFKGLPDNAEELNVLRMFRDTYLKEKPNGAALIKTYYQYSPLIVEAINARTDRSEILEFLYRVVRKCVTCIKRNDYTLAYETYCTMVIYLKNRFTPDVEMNMPEY